MAKKKPAKSAKVVGSDGSTLSEEFLTSVGGSRRVLKRQAWSLADSHTQGGEDQIWDFGWIPEEARDEVVSQGHQDAEQRILPRFVITGTPNRDVYEADLVDLTKTWKHPDVVAANGAEFTGTHQLTGSCVGAGGGNMWTTLSFVDALIRSEAEIPKVCFWLLPYGRSRFYCGMKSPGEGSTGSCFARAAVEDGHLEYDRQGLPQPTDKSDGWIWGRSVEMAWSDGDARQTEDLLPTSRGFKIQTAAKCKDHNDVREALVNGYPVTCASMYAHNGGKVQGSGKNACLIATRSGSWSHQMSILAWWKHPEFGELFWLMNQWGLRAHGVCPSGMPPGGVWIKASDVDWICRDEVYAFSGNNGFPAPAKPIPWIW